MSNIRTVSLNAIRTDGDTQARHQMSTEAASDYAEAMRSGAQFPPITLFEDSDGELWLADGFHRLEAAQQAGREQIEAEVLPGGQRDARLYAIGANASHGLRRTRTDKRNAVIMALDDPEASQWSNREIARWCAVDEKTVRNIKAEMETRDEIERVKAAELAVRIEQWDAENPQYVGYANHAATDLTVFTLSLKDRHDLDYQVLMRAIIAVETSNSRHKHFLVAERIDEMLGDGQSVHDRDWYSFSFSIFHPADVVCSHIEWISPLVEKLDRYLEIERRYVNRPDVIAVLEERREQVVQVAADALPADPIDQALAEAEQVSADNGWSRWRSERRQLERLTGVHEVQVDQNGITDFDMFLYDPRDSKYLEAAAKKLMLAMGDGARYRVRFERID